MNAPAIVGTDNRTFQQRVTDHVRNTFGSLITEEEMQLLITKEIKDFFESKTDWSVIKRENPNKSSYYQKNDDQVFQTGVTPFRMMVWEACRELMLKELKVYLDRDDNVFAGQVKQWFELTSFKEGQIMGMERLMLVMAGTVFSQLVAEAQAQTKMDLVNSLNRKGLVDVASAIQYGC